MRGDVDIRDNTSVPVKLKFVDEFQEGCAVEVVPEQSDEDDKYLCAKYGGEGEMKNLMIWRQTHQVTFWQLAALANYSASQPQVAAAREISVQMRSTSDKPFSSWSLDDLLFLHKNM